MSDEPEKTRWVDQVRERTRTIVRNAAEVIRSKAEDFEGSSLIERTRNLIRERSQQLSKADFQPSLLIERANRGIQARGAAFWVKGLTAVLCAWLLADVAAVGIDQLLPTPPPSVVARSMGRPMRPQQRTVDQYSVIWTRNLFNSEGKLPGEENTQVSDPGGTPVRTSLPFNLVGVVVLRDELRSIGTIEDKSAQTVYPVRATDEIPQKAKILSVLPDRVIFVNLQNNRREFIDLPEENVANPRVNVGRPRTSGGGVERTSPTQFNVSRTEIDKALQNLSQVLTQARAVPNFENGVPNGFKLFQIVPGSIFDKLGFQNGDVITGYNGQAVNDPGKAMELLGELKSANAVELSIKRDGRTMSNNYEIR